MTVELSEDLAVDWLAPWYVDTLTLMARGYTNQVIADTLFVSVHTVKSRVRVLKRRLGARDRADTVAAAYELGFLK